MNCCGNRGGRLCRAKLDFTTDELLEATEKMNLKKSEVELSHPIRKAIIRIDKMVLRKRFIIKKAPFFSCQPKIRE
jgi:hypothetical protein